jgi:Ca2+-binding EF-hand superfamily protein
MTVLMRGGADLRAAFLFKLCDAQCNGYVERRDLLYVLNASDNEQGRQMKLQELQQLTDKLFEESEPRGWAGEQPRVNIKPFQEWVRRYHADSVLLTWLMRSPLESFVRTPNSAADGSRQGPSNVHFDAIEIDALHDLHMRVRQSSPTGKVDQPAFESLFCPPLSVELARNLFAAFDEQCDGEVDINEFICGLSAICRGSVEASLEFCLSVRTEPGCDASYNRATLFSIVNSYIKLTGALQAVAGITEHLSETRSSSLSAAGSPRTNEVPEEIPLGRATSVPAIRNPDEDAEAEDELPRTSTAHPNAYKGEKEEMAMRLVEDLFVRFDKGEGESIAKEQVLEWLAESTKAQNFVKTIKRVTQASAGVRPAEPEEEKDVVEELLDQLSLKEPGAVFLVAQSWWSAWCAYSGSSDGGGGKPSAREGPGTINNQTILDQTATAQVLRLRAGLVADRDFKVLPRAAWATLHKWYGGGPEIRRQLLDTRTSDMRSVVVQEDVPDILDDRERQDLPLELYPLFIIIGTAGKGALPAWGRVTLQFSSTDRIEQVLHSAMTAFGDPPVARQNEHITQRVRLWSCHTPTIPVLLEDPSMTLADAKVVDGQYMELEDCMDSGEWSGESGRATRGQAAVAVTNQGQARTIGIPGIRNLGNTCYMNSALQCLSRAEPLKEYFLSQKHFADLEGREADMPVTVAYTQLMRSMWSPEAASTGLCDTGVLQDFKRTIGKFNDQFAGYNQQDVSEFLAFLIDGLHEEMNEIKIKPYVELDTDGKPNAELAQLAWDYHLSRERSVIGDAFSGQLMSTLRCSVCGNVSTSFDPFSTLPIELPLPETVAVRQILSLLSLRFALWHRLRSCKQEIARCATTI